MSFFVNARWGDSEDNPSVARMRDILAELDEQSDPEHPSAWLSHESGWTLSCYESGLAVWENAEQDTAPKHLQQIGREESLRLWVLLSQGKLEEIHSLPWKDGYAPPLTDPERLELQQQAEAATLSRDKEFYDSLGTEDDFRPCRREDCRRGSLRFSVFCRPHHFENLRGKPCPFNG